MSTTLPTLSLEEAQAQFEAASCRLDDAIRTDAPRQELLAALHAKAEARFAFLAAQKRAADRRAA